ncbi:PAS domain-containing protein [Bradyrhizobium diazoefficiens]|nr:PAS domain-containing protein [Bradyrhizobium diazoefficiens]MBR0777256.1 PAS domain-containing protein [Bradyrhizobium diazoefficiens]
MMGIGADHSKSKGTFPPAGGELAGLIGSLDWSTTSLGPIAGWPPHLKSAVNIMLPAQAQIVLFWGAEFVALYNDAYAPTIGEKHPKALGRPARESWSELWDDLGPLLRRVLETGETVSAKDRPFYIERHGYPENVYFDISYSPVRSDTGEIDGVLCIVSETTERVVAQAELARAQERLTLALSASGMVGTFDWHVQSDTFYSDARFAEMFSVDPDKGEKGAPLAEYLAGIYPEDVDRIATAVDHAVATRERYVQEYRLKKGGDIRWVEARGECLYDTDGKPDRFVGVVVDVTSQKNAQERQRLLAREADHRVKNIFANFHSLISLSARSSRTPQEMAQALRGRMDALLRAKDLVRPGIMGTEHESERTTVDALVRTVLQPYEDGSPGRIVLRGPNVPVGAKSVTGLALALHETATNAVKYGALSQPNGSIHVTWDANQDEFHLEWDEAGGPVIEAAPQARGFGTILTERSVASELGGKIEHDWRRDGLLLTLSVPLKQLAA